MYKRVKFKKSPLREVVYQINFPPILAIEANIPSDFQDAVREKFINYNEQIEQENQILINPSIPQNNPVFSSKQIRKIHMFTSDDGFWKLSLAKNMLSLSTLRYDVWEGMVDCFKEPLKAFINIYNPSFCNRVALRYVDVIDRELIGLSGVAWNELLNPHICGCLGYQSNENFEVQASKVEALLQFKEGTLKLNAGIGNKGFRDGKPKGYVFVLDCDYSKVGKFSIVDINGVSESIHEKATDFFQNAITEKLYIAMEPQELVKENE